MNKENLLALIDRVIGKEGILRVPAYWMRRILGKLMEYSDKTAESQARQALTDAKTYADSAIEEAVKEHGVTGDELKYYTLPAGVSKGVSINGTGRIDSYTFTDEEAAEWKKYYASPGDRVVRILMSDGNYMNSSSSTLMSEITGRPTFRFYWGQLTHIFESDGKLLYHILQIEIITENGKISSVLTDWPVTLPINVDSSMNKDSIQPVQNKVVKSYIDEEVSTLKTQLTNEITSNEQVTSASLNELRDKIAHLEKKLNALNQ